MFPCKIISKNSKDLSYVKCMELMENLVEGKKQGETAQFLIFIEHEPVITLGRQANLENILATEEELRKKQIVIYQTKRGGLVTYHGPGQLMAYCIFDLNKMGLSVKHFVWLLEESAIQTIDYFGIHGFRKVKHHGVWVGESKIASIGIAVSRGISYHGIALNYDFLDNFKLINPCGMPEVSMTSINKEVAKNIGKNEIEEYFCKKLFENYDLEFLKGN